MVQPRLYPRWIAANRDSTVHSLAPLHTQYTHRCSLYINEIQYNDTQGGAEWEVALNLSLGDDYVMLPKPLWDVMCDWYGGGPVFSRQVVKVSSSLQLPEKTRGGVDENGATSSPSPPDR